MGRDRQWREQAVTVPVGDGSVVLDGAWQAGERDDAAVIAAAHPLYGGTLDHPVCHELSYAFYRRGTPSLRFGWRGTGASSGGRSGDLDVAEADLRAALDHVALTVTGPIALAGYSFGAIAALWTAISLGRGDLAPTDGAQHRHRIRRIVCVAPPARMLAELSLADVEAPIACVVGSDDTLAPVTELRALLERAPGSLLEVVPGADHFFGVDIGDLSSALDRCV